MCGVEQKTQGFNTVNVHLRSSLNIILSFNKKKHSRGMYK